MSRLKLIILFCVLSILVLLGDDKQSIVLIIASAGILGLYIYEWYVHKTPYKIEKSTLLCWLLVILSLVVSSFSSLSLGYSITEFAKYILALLLFVYFSNMVSKKAPREFARYLFVWTVSMSILSLLFNFFPYLRGFVPNMNLLYKSFGHNHVVDLLFFGIPAGLFLLKEKKSIWIILGLLIQFVVFAASFSRGGLILLCVYGIYFLVYHAKIMPKLRWFLIITSLILATILFMVFSKGYLSEKTKPTVKDSRVHYWKQAVVAIKERPLLGWGPGTFYLVSKRFQEQPGSYSWYAHSFPLQIASELGVVGFITLCFLCYFTFRRITPSVASHGAILTLLYSFVEMNLDFTVIWVVFWINIGLMQRNASKEKSEDVQIYPFIALLFIGIFYSSSIIGNMSAVSHPGSAFPFLAQPYDVQRSLEFINISGDEKKLISPFNEKIIRYFHRDNSDVLFSLSRIQNIPQKKNQYLGEAIESDPKNINLIVYGISDAIKNNLNNSFNDYIEYAAQNPGLPHPQ